MIISSSVDAQTRKIKGTVTDSTGSPLAGVTILTDKKTRSAATDTAGNYSISVDANSTSLIFSYVGYGSQIANISSRSVIDVIMYPSRNELDDVVVIGYGTQRKSHLTGAISKYANERLDELPVVRVDQALLGKIAGVNVQNLDPEAGGTPRIRVRGLGSISAKADPLVVVDGHPIPDGLAFLNMADVQSIEVLKDAASAAIYGSRGGNGVILVTTKSGKSERPKYTVKYSTGVRSAYKTQDMMTVSEYVKMLFDEAALRENDPTVPASQKNRITTAERAQYVIENDIMGGPTDWQKEGIRNAMLHNVQLNVSGGKKDFRYFLSGGYNKEEGLMYHSDYEKFNIRSKIDAQLSQRVKVSLNINPSVSTRERPGTGYIDFVRFPSYLPVKHNVATAAFVNQVAQWSAIRPGDWVQAAHFNGRVYSGTMPDGSVWTTTTAQTPFATSNNTPKSIMESRDINSTEYRITAGGDITVNILKGLDLKSTGSLYITSSEGLDFTMRNSPRDGDLNRGIGTTRFYLDMLNENTLTYVKRFGDHNFNFLAGFTAQKTKVKNSRMEAMNFPSDNIRTFNTALQFIPSSETFDATTGLRSITGSYTLQDQIGLLSYLGRIMYDYKDRYLFSASFRRDGSSYFGPGRKWANFPAFSFGWVVTKEKFMSNIDWLSQLKLRASYGLSGNNSIESYAWIDLLYSAPYAFGSGTGTVSPGQGPANFLANPDITWERTYQPNLGIDLGLFKNALTITVEMYKSQTDQLLLKQNIMAFAGAETFWDNVGRVQNKGIEVEVTSHNFRKKNFTWTTSANLSANENTLTNYGDETFQNWGGEANEQYRSEVGFQSIRYYGYKTDGVWLSQTEADAAKATEVGKWGASNGTIFPTYFTAGGLKLIDINSDGRITQEDRTEIGSPFPKFTWGINNSFTYKNFDLSFLLQGVQGVDIYNGDARYNESRKYNSKYVENRWISAANPGDGKTPYFTTGVDWMLTDYPIEDGSYFSVREVILGYRLSPNIAKRMRLSGLRFYVSAQNLYVHFADNYRGINPEARTTSGLYNNPLIDGYQRGVYPMQRGFLAGIDINF